MTRYYIRLEAAAGALMHARAALMGLDLDIEWPSELDDIADKLYETIYKAADADERYQKYIAYARELDMRGLHGMVDHTRYSDYKAYIEPLLDRLNQEYSDAGHTARAMKIAAGVDETTDER
jgi:hypothetical protein